MRPQNFPAGTPGRGAAVFAARGGRKVMVLNVMGRLFMDPLDDPFACVERELAKQRLGGTVDAIILDVHAEATAVPLGTLKSRLNAALKELRHTLANEDKADMQGITDMENAR